MINDAIVYYFRVDIFSFIVDKELGFFGGIDFILKVKDLVQNHFHKISEKYQNDLSFNFPCLSHFSLYTSVQW